MRFIPRILYRGLNCIDCWSSYRYHLSGMDMGLGDYDGRTALHLAASEGHLACVEYLVKKCKVDTNPKDRYLNKVNLNPNI